MNPGTLAPESVFSVHVNTLKKSNQPAWGLARGREARERGAWPEGRGGGAARGAAARAAHLGLNRN